MDKCEKKTDRPNGDSFISLLWDDILFSKILPLLSIRDLFILRGLSRRYKLLIDSYFKQMKYLNLVQYSTVFSINAFKVLADKCTQLKTLIASNCQWLTDDLITPLFEKNKQLRKIVLNQCKNLTSVCLQPVIINCKSLETLCLAGCCWLTIGCLESITLHQRNLKEVDFSDCIKITSLTSINNFLSLSHGLKSLNISKLNCVDDLTMSVIAHNARELEILNIRGCRHVSTHGVRFVIEYCLKLKAVVCLGCPLVFPHVLQVKHRPSLRVFCDTPVLFPHVLLPRINV